MQIQRALARPGGGAGGLLCETGLVGIVLPALFLVSGSTNVGEQLPTGQLSVVPWRRTGVKYTNNEAYFDVIEEIDAIIEKSGTGWGGETCISVSSPLSGNTLG